MWLSSLLPATPAHCRSRSLGNFLATQKNVPPARFSLRTPLQRGRVSGRMWASAPTKNCQRYFDKLTCISGKGVLSLFNAKTGVECCVERENGSHYAFLKIRKENIIGNGPDNSQAIRRKSMDEILGRCESRHLPFRYECL